VYCAGDSLIQTRDIIIVVIIIIIITIIITFAVRKPIMPKEPRQSRRLSDALVVVTKSANIQIWYEYLLYSRPT